MSEMQIFNYNQSELRTIEKDGEIWWVLKDVCGVLGIVDHKSVARRLDDDEKGVGQILPLSGGPEQPTCIINEPGLYNVILRSDKPEAKDFKRWVTHEVLPQIRSKGTYTAQPKMTPAQILAAQAGLLVEMEARMDAVQAMQDALSERVDKAIEVFSRPSEDHWKADMDKAIKQMCAEYHQSERQMRGFLYAELEEKVNCSVNSRLTRLRARMRKAGARYRDVMALNKLDAIAADKSLRAVFEGILRSRQSRFAIVQNSIIQEPNYLPETEAMQDE